MTPTLIALAGPSRSGKGSCAAVIRDLAAAHGLTFCERQLSGPGKQYVASAWWPEITEQNAIELFEQAKNGSDQRVSFTWMEPDPYGEPWQRTCGHRVPLQEYLQRMLQGARDRWGEDFWTDKIIPQGRSLGNITSEFNLPSWCFNFTTGSAHRVPVDVAVISDLRQESEARRVRQLGGIVVELHRPQNDDAYRTGTGHITEQRLPGHLVDYTILNDGTVGTLRSLATAYFTKVLEARS